MISSVLFPRASQPRMNFNIPKLAYSYSYSSVGKFYRWLGCIEVPPLKVTSAKDFML